MLVSKDTEKILISSASKKTGMIGCVKEAAKRFSPSFDVVVGDSNQLAISRYVADDFWHMPSTDEKNTSTILSWIIDNKVRMIIPTRDEELEFWAIHENILNEEGVVIMLSDQKSLELCSDKIKFSRSCIDHGLPVIPSFLDPMQVRTPFLVVKERKGSGSASIGIKLDKNQAIQHAKGLIDPIFQPFIAGNEISIDAYIRRSGDIHGMILRCRDFVVNGESQITTTFTDKAIETRVSELIDFLNLRGHVVIQLIIDDKGNLNIVECNCRFGGASTLSVYAGLDSFFWFILESQDEELSSHPFHPKSRSITQVRILKDIYFDGDHI